VTSGFQGIGKTINDIPGKLDALQAVVDEVSGSGGRAVATSECAPEEKDVRMMVPKAVAERGDLIVVRLSWPLAGARPDESGLHRSSQMRAFCTWAAVLLVGGWLRLLAWLRVKMRGFLSEPEHLGSHHDQCVTTIQ
jgi:hypothetical protein